MAKCPECGSEVADIDIFCPYCGITLKSADADVEETEESLENTIAISGVSFADADQTTPAAADSPEPFDMSGSADVETHIGQAEEEPAAASFDEIPIPMILSGAPKTSDNLPKSTADYLLDAVPVPDELKMEDAAPVAEPDIEPPTMISMTDLATPGSGEIRPADAQKPEGSELFRERLNVPDAGIGRPSVDFDKPEHKSAFDSVRIMENPSAGQENIDTRIPGRPFTGSADLAPAPVQDNETAGAETGAPSPTEPNIGRVDTDGRKSAKLKPLTEGIVLNGRYEIVRKIGGGGMGAVYLASDNNLGGVLRAVKEMVQAHIEESQQEKSVNDFKRESMILSTLDHPAIPTIYDYFYDDKEGRFYLVMKYISGGDLSSRLRAAPEGKIDERVVTEWAIQIIDVLDYLHNQPSTIVYRDLKPSNIMIDGNSGRIMLIDFGIARSISHREEKGVTAVGTMGYAPPELFSGNVEPRSDIYSLGSTMFHLLTGADPQSNPLLIFDFQKNPRPRQINPQLSDQMERILMRSVEYSADARFSSAAEMRRVLEDHLEHLKSGDLS
ncbi:MAG TPA: serine/threonine-protein kinase, partial [Pyrinomonadaceae bacterium]|nr:serine/threonine-protein kinase [Pyrinomonadaceae bacterium]